MFSEAARSLMRWRLSSAFPASSTIVATLERLAPALSEPSARTSPVGIKFAVAIYRSTIIGGSLATLNSLPMVGGVGNQA